MQIRIHTGLFKYFSKTTCAPVGLGAGWRTGCRHIELRLRLQACWGRGHSGGSSWHAIVPVAVLPASCPHPSLAAALARPWALGWPRGALCLHLSHRGQPAWAACHPLSPLVHPAPQTPRPLPQAQRGLSPMGAHTAEM